MKYQLLLFFCVYADSCQAAEGSLKDGVQWTTLKVMYNDEEALVSIDKNNKNILKVFSRRRTGVLAILKNGIFQDIKKHRKTDTLYFKVRINDQEFWLLTPVSTLFVSAAEDNKVIHWWKDEHPFGSVADYLE